MAGMAMEPSFDTSNVVAVKIFVRSGSVDCVAGGLQENL